ncbi:hypothetical protein GGQ64_005068 [Rhizobium azooxidifex]|uniref:Outer membrane protein beta-barrel domain-containing protein n=1 Tax=Mycoplana azooxidifex TaxID=1636188 RepID=A0A7W6DAV0_9HYPH|nr:hypothetical protein [Mycoplana azooxidifex]MBB3979823.1 hypothetical protein [Mycoplana azooxidifex]
MKLISVCSIVFASALTLSPSAKAADKQFLPFQPEAGGETSSVWQFNASPYFWAAGIDGTVGQFGLPPASLKSGFGDILKHLDFAFMGVAEGRYDSFSVSSDHSPAGILTNNIGVTSETFSGLVGGGYSLLTNGRNHLDVIVGARLWYASTKVSFSGGVLDGVSREDSATWIDAVAGFRGTYFFTDQFYLTGWGNVGAGQADLDWDVAGAIGYQIKDSISAVAGYRAMGVDYSSGGFDYDVVQKGPIPGLVFHF